MQKNAHIDKVREAVSCLFVEGIGDSEYLELLRDGIELNNPEYTPRVIDWCAQHYMQHTAQAGKGGRGEK